MLSSEFVLIFDSDPVNAALLKFALEEKGIRSLISQNWNSLLERLTNTDLRLLIFHSDDTLPVVMEQLREIYSRCFPNLPLILTTHDCTPERIQSLQEKAGVRVICKPYNFHSLIKLVQEKFVQEQADYFLYRELEFKESLIRHNQMLQEQVILLSAVNNELLKPRESNNNSTQELILLAVDTELRYLYFTPDHANGMRRIFSTDIQIGTKVTDFPWPESFRKIANVLAESFEGKEVSRDFYLNFDSVNLFIKAKAIPLKLPNQAVFGVLLRMDQYYADQIQDNIPRVTMNSYFHEEFVSMALRHLKGIYLVCDEHYQVIYCIQNQANLPPPSFFTNKPITEFLVNPLDLDQIKNRENSQALWVHWKFEPHTTKPLQTTYQKIKASIYHQAQHLIIIHTESSNQKDMAQFLVPLWEQEKFPIEVYDQDGRLLSTNRAWKLRMSKNVPQKTSLPIRNTKSHQTLRLHNRWWKVFFFPNQHLQTTTAVYIPLTSTKRTRWLDGPEVVNLLAHQWRQPLAQLGSLINVLTLKTSMRPEAHHDIVEKLERAQFMIQHLSKTIDDFRKFMFPNKVKTQVDLVELCQTIALLFKEKIIELDVDWCWEIEYQPILVSVYSGLLSQALIEAIHNCFMALEKVDHQRNLTFKLRHSTDRAELEIQHNGKRFPSDVLNAFLHHKKLKSTGMGLKFIRRVICKLHQGHYKIFQDERGVTQLFQLPGDKDE